MNDYGDQARRTSGTGPMSPEPVGQASAGAGSGAIDTFFESRLAWGRKVWDLSGDRFLREAPERLVVPLYALYLMRTGFNRAGLEDTIRDCVVHQRDTVVAFEAGHPDEAAHISRGFFRRMKDCLGTPLLPTDTHRQDCPSGGL